MEGLAPLRVPPSAEPWNLPPCAAREGFLVMRSAIAAEMAAESTSPSVAHLERGKVHEDRDVGNYVGVYLPAASARIANLRMFWFALDSAAVSTSRAFLLGGELGLLAVELGLEGVECVLSAAASAFAACRLAFMASSAFLPASPSAVYPGGVGSAGGSAGGGSLGGVATTAGRPVYGGVVCSGMVRSLAEWPDALRVRKS